MADRKRKLSLFDQEAPTSSGSLHPSASDPTLAQVNPWTGRPYTQRFKDILTKRVTLPVYQQRQDFIEMLKTHQSIVLVGETGSGKTTQVRSPGAHPQRPEARTESALRASADPPVRGGGRLHGRRQVRRLHAAPPCGGDVRVQARGGGNGR